MVTRQPLKRMSTVTSPGSVPGQRILTQRTASSPQTSQVVKYAKLELVSVCSSPVVASSAASPVASPRSCSKRRKASRSRWSSSCRPARHSRSQRPSAVAPITRRDQKSAAPPCQEDDMHLLCPASCDRRCFFSSSDRKRCTSAARSWSARRSRSLSICASANLVPPACTGSVPPMILSLGATPPPFLASASNQPSSGIPPSTPACALYVHLPPYFLGLPRCQVLELFRNCQPCLELLRKPELLGR
mmetsp:Transcript_33418/g.103755  ORF Transcript_33418/g.103755 Transcript_33418/m.103755 type:complete len:246 (-) Transcript_33418:1194-1931(-)